MRIQKNPTPFRINGVNVDKEALKGIKSIKALKKLNIFSHLSDADKDAAEAELAKELGITQQEEIVS